MHLLRRKAPKPPALPTGRVVTMSFALTTPQVLARTKTVTRRMGFEALAPGDEIRMVVKAQGLKKGEKQQEIGRAIVTDVRREVLRLITPEDCVAEGFPELQPVEFVRMFCKHMDCQPGDKVRRIEFRYLDGTNDILTKASRPSAAGKAT